MPSARARTIYARLLKDFERNLGTVDGRNRIRTALERVRRDPYYWNSPDYWMLWGEVFAHSIQCGSDARRSFERAAELAPTSITARLRATEMHYRSMRATFDREGMADALALIRQAVRVDPLALHPDATSAIAKEAFDDHLESLHLASALLCMDRTGHGVTREQFLTLAQEAYDYTHLILLRTPRPSSQYLALHAVNCLDLGRVRDAEDAFYAALDAMKAEGDRGEVYYWVPTALRNTDFLTLGPDERERFLETYWENQDPTQLTLVNERQLQYWRNLTIARLYMELNRSGIPGGSIC